jgi:hypothetical protein
MMYGIICVALLWEVDALAFLTQGTKRSGCDMTQKRRRREKNARELLTHHHQTTCWSKHNKQPAQLGGSESKGRRNMQDEIIYGKLVKLEGGSAPRLLVHARYVDMLRDERVAGSFLQYMEYMGEAVCQSRALKVVKGWTSRDMA